MPHRLLAFIALFFALVVTAGAARASEMEHAILELAQDDPDAIAQAVGRLGSSGEPGAYALLAALHEQTLRVAEDGAAYIDDAHGFRSALTGLPSPRPSGKLRAPLVNNSVRRILLPTLAKLELGSPDPKLRLSAAQELMERPLDDAAPALRAAYDRERDPEAKTALALALAEVDLASEDPMRRINAIHLLGKSGRSSAKSRLESIVAKRASGDGADGDTFVEPDPHVRAAANDALASIERSQSRNAAVGNIFYGVSLASVLLLAALGLSISFGLMRVINMAHGEMLMLGAYATYVVQRGFQIYLPNHFEWYLLAAVPTAFVVAMLVGILLERTVIRFLYGRPLETLLATWGISLIIIQTVRLVFGAQNVAVANPSWLSGGITVLDGIVFSYNRIATIGFALIVLLFVWLLLNRTPLGLQVRAVTQNRSMAAAMGIPTGRVDMWTFGLGAGVGGLGGVALSQLGNVGPELGQSYIVDSFMVVVLGGVGKLAGSVAAASGLGIINKLIEPFAGAVLGKIFMLVFVILFIQKRPEGLFALNDRSA